MQRAMGLGRVLQHDDVVLRSAQQACDQFGFAGCRSIDMTVLLGFMDALPPSARELLQLDGAELRRRWEGCQDAAALEAAITQYKEALEAVLQACKRLGEWRLSAAACRPGCRPAETAGCT